MQHLNTNELGRRAVRVGICPTCTQRPGGSEALGPTEARSCESACPIFHALPALQRMIAEHDSQLDSIEQALRNNICNHCSVSPTSGDYCSESLARTCPLSRYSLDVVQLLERLPQPVGA